MPPNEISNLGYDSSRITVIDLNFEMRWPFDSSYQRTDLSTKEILLLEALIKEKIASYNLGIENDRFESFGIDTLRFEYKRQYLPAKNGKGEKIVLANYFCQRHDRNWKVEFIEVDDGGNCFFRIVVNLSTGEMSQLYINSLARLKFNRCATG